MKKLLIGLIVIVIAVLTYLRYGKQPDPFDHNTFSYHMLQPGPYTVQAEEFEFIDQTRTTASSGDYPGSDSRLLQTRIWQPVEQNRVVPGPLVLYSHGFMSSRIGGRPIARHLASHGYTVVAPDFPLTNFQAPGPQQWADVINQPADLTFLLDKLLERNRTKGDKVYRTIDEERIAAIGMSSGGLTSTLAGFHPSQGDPRIAAVVSIAGPSVLFSKQFFSFRAIPFMMIASPIDALVDYSSNARPILDKVAGAILVSIDNASHTGFAYPAISLRWFDNPDKIGCWSITRKFGAKNQLPGHEAFGSSAQGIEQVQRPNICQSQSLAAAMNPIAQQRLTTLAVTSFLESLFAAEASERERHRQFLTQQLAHENNSVTVEVSEIIKTK